MALHLGYYFNFLFLCTSLPWILNYYNEFRFYNLCLFKISSSVLFLPLLCCYLNAPLVFFPTFWFERTLYFFDTLVPSMSPHIFTVIHSCRLFFFLIHILLCCWICTAGFKINVFQNKWKSEAHKCSDFHLTHQLPPGTDLEIEGAAAFL